MNEVKTYSSFIVVSLSIIGILVFLYSPNTPVHVIENIESRSLGSLEEVEETNQPEETVWEESTTQDPQELQRRRIHYTKILLRKQAQLEKLRDQQLRDTREGTTYKEDTLDLEADIEQIKESIRALQG